MTTNAKLLSDYRSPDFTIRSVELTVELDPTDTRITSVMKVQRLNQAAQALVLDGEALRLEHVDIDGVVVADDEYSVDDVSLTLPLDQSEAMITIVTRINPTENTSLEGLYMSDGAFCTQCEAEGFRKITFYLDRPDVLATFQTTVIGDETKYPYLLSNGNEVSRSKDGQKLSVTWQDPHPKPCYLFALVAGDFDVLDDSFTTMSGREVALRLFVDKGNLNRADYAMASLKHSMKWDEDVYGLEYDLDIYMIVAVDFFNMGAMENKGLNVFNSKYVLANVETATDHDFNGIEAVIGHEYFHNWTGNRVTCRDWFQLSLKEGLTVFRDQSFSQDMTQSSVNRIDDVAIMRSHQFAEDSGPMAHPIRPKSVVEMNNFYTVTVYNKGAEVIRMMHTLLGKEGFRKGMDLYFARHDGKAVTCDDFVEAMEDANSFDLGRFRQWYEQAGTPTVTATGEYDAANRSYRLELAQSVPPTADEESKQHTHIPLRIGLYGANGEVIDLNTEAPLTDGNVYSLVEPTAELIFTDVDAAPTPALLLDFSAPVKLEFDYSDTQLLTLFKSCDDGFTRWDAGQQLLTRYVFSAMKNSAVLLPADVLQGFVSVANDSAIDAALKSKLLSMPAVSGLVNQMKDVNIHSLLDALDVVRKQLAESLFESVQQLFNSSAQPNFELTSKAMGLRMLKSVALDWIANHSPSIAESLVTTEFENANNMTDTLAALKVANTNSLHCRSELMTSFFNKWKDDGLVMDKWLALQGGWDNDACQTNLAEVEATDVFTLHNPNRARSLISGFSNMNYRRFHAKDGSGYQWLADKIIALNAINPQIAARLVNPLTHWKKFNTDQGELMKQSLTSIWTIDALSKDLKEVIGKSLNG